MTGSGRASAVAVAVGLCVAVWSGGPARAQQSTSQPGRVDQALPEVPAGISDYDVELFGRFAYLWSLADGTSVVQYVGDFGLQMGPRRLSSRDAVVWIRRRKWRGRNYQDIEVFLWRDAKVVEPAGTVSTGPMLLVTLRSFGAVHLNADATSDESAEQTQLYRQAEQVRRQVAEAAEPRPEEPKQPLKVVPAERRVAPAPRVRQPVGFSAKQLIIGQYESQPVATAIGQVYLWQGARGAGDFLEIRADA
ncbi:MAG: hypothetical protein ACE5K7_04130, partial [Phycisphaerae bacterium]